MSHLDAIHTALAPGNVAVVTGAASGIGRAAALRFAGGGMKVVMADLPGEALVEAQAATAEAAGNADAVIAAPTDVSSFAALERLREVTEANFGTPSVLMNNAGVGLNPGGAAKDLAAWKRLIDVNFWGVAHGVLETGHRHAAGQRRLQCLQGRREGADRAAGARAAQHRGLPGFCPPADPGVHVHGDDCAGV